ncbi:MAG: hypothetical protein ACRDCE_15120 [Cetobacterium sp.]|uniref:hypothetical protein n=1 Tax=Cetobacterium sp. TaxID=2071632 RepID=UPI003EE7D899
MADKNIPSGNSRGKPGVALYKPGFIDNFSDDSLKLSIERENDSIANAFLKMVALNEALEKRVAKLENP